MATIKYGFMGNLIIILHIIDLPDEIDTIVYSQWLLKMSLKTLNGLKILKGIH